MVRNTLRGGKKKKNKKNKFAKIIINKVLGCVLRHVRFDDREDNDRSTEARNVELLIAAVDPPPCVLGRGAERAEMVVDAP